MAETELGDVVINGTKFRIDLQTWKVRDLADFAPRSSTPGGSVIHSDLLLYQPMLQTDWRHGFGHHWYDDAMGYLATEGRVDTRQPGIAMMYTGSTSMGADTNLLNGFITFNSTLYKFGAGGLSSWTSGTTWANLYNTATVNCALATKTYLFYCGDGQRIQKMTTGGVHTTAGVDANATDYRWLIVHNGYIYAGKDGTNEVYYDSNEDLSQLHGDVAGDTNEILVGGGGIPTIGAIVYASNLYIARQDGLWVLGEDMIARRVLDFTNEINSTNFKSMCVYNGYMIFPVQDVLYQWNGARLSRITPPKVTDTFPYTTYGAFDNLVAIGDFVYCTAYTNESTPVHSLLCFDGTSWTRLADLTPSTGTTTSTPAMGYDPVHNYIVYQAVGGSAGTVYYIPLQARSSYPYAAFMTTGTHSVISSRLDMGYRRVVKSTPSMLVEASNVSSTVYLLVYYSLDGAAWVAWGGTDGTTNKISSAGVTELTNPLGSATVPSIEYKYLKIKVVFVTGTATSSPILEGLTVRFLLRPEVFWGFNFTVVAARDYDMGPHNDNRYPYDVISALRTIRDSKAPVAFIDIYGVSYYGYISSLNESAIERHEYDVGSEPNIEGIAQVNFVEAR